MGGIYLRWDRLQDFMGDLRYLPLQTQARQLEMRPLNLHRAKEGHRVGDRTIAEILTGVAVIARRRGAEPPTFEQLFEIRPSDLTPAQGRRACNETDNTRQQP